MTDVSGDNRISNKPQLPKHLMHKGETAKYKRNFREVKSRLLQPAAGVRNVFKQAVRHTSIRLRGCMDERENVEV